MIRNLEDIPAGFAADAARLHNADLMARYGVSVPTICRWRKLLDVPSPRRFSLAEQARIARLPAVAGAAESITRDPEFETTLPEPRRYREVGLDIETTNLRGDFGMILCACLKPVGEAPIVLRLDEYDKRKPWDDTPLVRDLIDRLSECSKAFGWYSGRFDIPFIRTRKTLDRIEESVTLRHTDLLQASRRGLLIHNHRLETLMNLFAANKKTDIRPEAWRRAGFGDKAAMDVVVEHCVEDVKGMEQVYFILEPYVQTWSQVTL